MDYADDGTLENKIIAKINEAVDYGGEIQYFSESQVLHWFT